MKTTPAQTALKIFGLLIFLFTGPVVSAAESKWMRLPSLPEKLGLGAPFAGVSGGALIVAGGANFPNGFPWEGGVKVWSDKVWILDQPGGHWRQRIPLPRPAAYGASVTWRNSIVCAGGSNRDGHLTDVFQMRWADEKLTIRLLPSLPRPLANTCGALLGDTFYLAGGIETPQSTNALRLFLAIDLSATRPAWRTLDPWPGPGRMLAVAAAIDHDFFVISGTDLSAGPDGKPVRHYLRDAYRFSPGKGWRRLADLPRPAVAAASPAPRFSPAQFLVISGDDGTQVQTAPSRHPGFTASILSYDVVADRWIEDGSTPAPRATVPTALWGGRWILISGEEKPGIRSPEVWGLESPSLKKQPAIDIE